MKNLFRLTALIFIFFVGFSCTKKLNDPGATATVKMSNEWWVTLSSGGQDLIGTHVLFATYNTAQNQANSLWLDDLNNGYQFKCKVNADPVKLTFSVDSAQNESYDIKVSIANGRIFPKGGISKTGFKTDSIYMEAHFSDDPVNTYVISGTARTELAADDY